mgnify:CR=1 FL=1
MGHATAWPYFYTQKSVTNLVKYAECWAFFSHSSALRMCKPRRVRRRRNNKMSKWEIMQRVADTRKEIETFAQDWADVPGGTRNPLAMAHWE